MNSHVKPVETVPKTTNNPERKCLQKLSAKLAVSDCRLFRHHYIGGLRPTLQEKVEQALRAR